MESHEYCAKCRIVAMIAAEDAGTDEDAEYEKTYQIVHGGEPL